MRRDREVKNKKTAHKYKDKQEWVQQEIRKNYSKPVSLKYSAKDLDKVLKMTAEMTGVSRRDVEYIIDHTWTYVSDWVKNPHTCGVLLLHEFGSFSLNLGSLNIQIRNLIPFLRGEDRDDYIERFKELWRRRQLAIHMENWKRNDGRVFHFSKGVSNE